MEVTSVQEKVNAVVKTIKDLPAPVQIKIWEVFQKASTCSSPQNVDFSVALKSLSDQSQIISGENARTEGNSPLGECTKNQRTLDNWLIKKSNSSPSKNKETTSTFQPGSDATEILSQTAESIVNNTPSSASSTEDVSYHKLIKCSKPTESKCEKIKDAAVILNKLATTISDEPNNLAAEPSYNLRSKRKPKVARNNENIQSEISVHNCQSTQDLSAELSVVNIVSPSCSVSSPQKCVDSKSVENRSTEGSSGSTNESSVKQATYNLKMKKKSGKSLENVLEYNNIPGDAAEQSSINNDMPTVLGNQEHNSQSSSQYNCEAFCKVRKACTKVGLNIFEILQDGNVQNILSDQTFHNDGIVFMGTHKSVSGRLVPVVHAHESKAKLLQNLYEVQKCQSKQS